MKSNNQYLKGIANNTGSNVSANRSDNYYLKRIEENTKNGSGGGSGGSGFSGDYNDLTNKPTIPTDVSQLTDNNNTAFTPKAHNHSFLNISDVETVQVEVTYEDDSTDTINLLCATNIPTPK